MLPLRTKFFCSFFLLVIHASFLSASPQIDKLRANIIGQLVSQDYSENPSQIAASLRIDGSFGDIDYQKTDAARWEPLRHLDRLVVLAQAFHDPTSGHFKSLPIVDKINLGLMYWFNAKPNSINWWNIDIGQQLRLGPILVLMLNDLPKPTIKRGARYLKDPSEITPKMTGQNFLWFTVQGIYRGVIRESSPDILKNIEFMNSEIKITLDEGIQPDFSFHQHGPQLYSGGYGYAFIRDITQWIGIFMGTGFQLEPDKIATIAEAILDGFRWMVRGPNIDPSVGGREIARQDYANRGSYIAQICQIMSAAFPARRAEFLAFKREIDNPFEGPTLQGGKAFYRSDYLVHRTPRSFFSLRLFSNRTIGTEMINDENIRGYWLPFGLTVIQSSGTEHQDIYPVWDWSRLPGVTAPQMPPPFTKYLTTNAHEVSVLSTGDVSVGTTNYPGSLVKAQKLWFFQNDSMIALGTGITSDEKVAILTSIEQNLAQDKAIVDGTEFNQLPWTSEVRQWVWHRDIAYFLLRPAKTTAQVVSQRGSWRKINLQYPEMPLYKNVFSLWIDHGIQPQLSAYAYMVVNGLSASQAALLSKQTSVNILHNTSELQAAYDVSSHATAAVFRVAGSLLLPSGHSLKVSAPSVIIVHDKPPGKITVGPLDARNNSVTVTQIAPNQTHRRWLAEFSRLPSAEKKAESPWPLETKAE